MRNANLDATPRWHALRGLRVRHPGFTLVELLVVIAIFMVLAGLIIAFFPGVQDQQRVVSGVNTIQGALQISKQRALRDQAPRGIRLIVDTNLNLITEFEYIEQPDDYVPPPTGLGALTVPDPNLPPPIPPALPKPIDIVQLSGIDVQNGSATGGPGPQAFWSVQPQDYLEMYGSGTVHRITGISVIYNLSGTPDSYLKLANPLPRAQPVPSRNYRIIRRPRPTGEDTIRLPREIAVDHNINALSGTAFFNPLPVSFGNIDILFSPSGRVMSRGVQTPFIALWVRDMNADDPNAPLPDRFYLGGTTIIGINVQTGAVGPYDPAVNVGDDPYMFLKSGRTTAK